MNPNNFQTLRARGRGPRTRSQSLAEFAMILPIFLTLMCGVFDYGFMIGSSHVMAMAAREGANTAARQDTEPNLRGLRAAVDAGRPRISLDDERGGVIITRVSRVAGDNTYVYVEDPITNNCVSTGLIYGGGDTLKNRSLILAGGSNWYDSARRMPFAVENLALGQEMSVVEIFLTNQFVTPIGTILGLVTPPVLYDAAYF